MFYIAKYEYKEDKQSGLRAHVDGTPWSFVVALNDPSTEFTGTVIIDKSFILITE